MANRFYQKPSITALKVWTEIYSYIKGSVDAHTYYGSTLPLKKYKEIRKDMKEEE